MVYIRKIVFLLFFLMLVLNAPAQSGQVRQSPDDPPAANGGETRSVESLFDETTEYAVIKFKELEKSKTPYSQPLHEQILREQKQKAALYAAEVAARKDLAGEDFY